MRRIGIIAAMEPEIDLLREALNNSSEDKRLGMSFYEGVIGNNEVILSLCGVGKVNSSIACALLIDDYECDLIINTVIAGGVVPLNTRDVVIAKELKYHDFDTTIFGYSYGQVPGMPKSFVPNIDSILLVKRTLNKLNIPYKEGAVYSGDQFVSSLDKLKHIDSIEGIACEMEGASIAQVCIKAGVDFIVLRYISDIIGSPNQVKDYLAFEEEMAKRSANICLQILNNLE